MGLLDEIQKDALSDTTTVSTILRKVLVLASHLDSEVLEDWVRHELNGYPIDATLPTYRELGLSFKASVRNMTMHHRAFPIAPYIVQKASGRKDMDRFRCRQAIGTIDPLVNNEGDTMAVNFDNLGILIQRELAPGNEVMGFWGEVPTASMVGILDAVRNRVLDFVLTLRKAYPHAGEVGGLAPSTPEVEKAVTTIYQTNIHGNNAGLIGNATNSTVNVSVVQGNITDLRHKLSSCGVEPVDLDDLEQALRDEPTISEGRKFGPKVSAWMGKMLGKAASGTWKVGLETGGRVLEKTLLSYFGVDN